LVAIGNSHVDTLTTSPVLCAGDFVSVLLHCNSLSRCGCGTLDRNGGNRSSNGGMHWICNYLNMFCVITLWEFTKWLRPDLFGGLMYVKGSFKQAVRLSKTGRGLRIWEGKSR